MGLKQLFEKVTGLDKIREQALAEIQESLRLAKEAEEAAAAAKEAERIAKLSPKELATENKEPWVQVLETHINKDNVRNGFFELDWNEYFVVQLKASGYTGETDEEVVDRWFQSLCQNIGGESNVNMDRRGSGYVNRALRDDGLTEIS